MKHYTLFFLLIFCPRPSLQAQKTITLDVKGRPLLEILPEIEKQSGYTFSYTPSLLKGFAKVTLRAKNEPLEKVLHRLFGQSDIRASVQGKYIILKKRPRNVVVSGFVYDRESHEPLIGANLYEEISGEGAATNNFGFYSFSVAPDEEIRLRSSYVGYMTAHRSIAISGDSVMDFFLEPSSLLKEVVVEGNLRNAVHHAETGKISLEAATLKAVPAFMGESDVVKTLQHMPGVAAGTDGMAGLYVRGGNADENLYLVDGNPLYHIHHLLGIFSAFNPEAVKTMDFYKGSFPGRYGGRLSSVMDVRMNDGDMKKYSGTASVGLISSRFSLQGPIVKDRTSFSVSLRRTYLDLLARSAMFVLNRRNKKKDPLNYEHMDFGYYFYDFNAKFTHRFSDKSRIYLSVYDGKDQFFGESHTIDKNETTYVQDDKEFLYTSKYEDNISINLSWGNRMASVNWAYAIHPRLFSNATLVYSRYWSDIGTSSELIQSSTSQYAKDTPPERKSYYALYHPIYRSGIEDVGYRLEMDYARDNRHRIRFGTALLHHHFRPEESRVYNGLKDGQITKNDTITYADENIGVTELSLYAEDEMDLGKRWKVNAGLHLSGFFVQGRSYVSAQPRLSARYLLSPDFSVKASFGKMHQYVHLLQNSYLSAPTDLWVPVTRNIKPLSSHQFSAGIYGKYQGFDLSAEAYYKKSTNQIDYKDGVGLLTGNLNWEQRVAQGVGVSYGLEMMARKRFGNTTGWVGYTLSWANRRFPGGEINQGKTFPARYDNRHKLNAVLSHTFNKHFDINLSWMYASGNNTTLPEEQYVDINGQQASYIQERNNFKMPGYQRLDISVNYYRHKKKGRMGIWNFSIYNVYAHHNSFIVLPSEGFAPGPDSIDGYPQHSYPTYQSYCIFPFIPSFSYTYTF